MKTKDLIAALQKADPSGEEHVVVDNFDILAVWREPAYYDGYAQRLIRDDSNPFYNVVGAEYVNDGDKVRIAPHPIEDAIWENPELPVAATGRYATQVAKWREEATA